MNAKLLDTDKACMLVALRVSHADADKCADKLREINGRLIGFDGFDSLDVIRRDGGLGTDYYVIVRFSDMAALERWKNSPERERLTTEVEAFAIADVSRVQASGANIWFEPVVSLPSTPKPPLLWKRWLTSMIAVYPALIVLVFLLQPVTSRLPVFLGLFVVAVILTGLTTAFIVPWLTRTLHPWLTRR